MSGRLGGYESCHATAVFPSPVFAYKSNAIDDLDGVGVAEKVRDIYMQVVTADHVVMAMVQVLERSRPWLK